MNYIRFRMLLLASIVFAQSINAYTEKTFLAPRPVGVNLAMEYTSWHNPIRHDDENHPSKKGLNRHHPRYFQVTGFYQESVNDKALGRYFGIKNKNTFQIGDQPAAIANPATTDVDGSLIIHEQNAASAQTHTLKGIVNFKPKQDIWGARLDFINDDFPINNLYFKASLPVVRVTNNMHMTICDSKAVSVAGKEFSLVDFFAGNVKVNPPVDPLNPQAGEDATNLQSPLCAAKICGARSTTGVADLDLMLGYKAWETENHHVYVNMGLTIPTGKTPNGRYLFEPMMGNGGHFALGAGIDSGFTLWESDRSILNFIVAANYRFLLEGHERRTLGLNDCNFTSPLQDGSSAPAAINNISPVKLLHYHLLAKDQQVNQPLFPAANILTQRLLVEPGSQLDAIAAFSFNFKGFVADLGYNLFWKDKERVNGYNCFCLDTRYGIANGSYSTEDIFNGADTAQQRPLNNKILSGNDVNLDAVRTPSTSTHKIFAGLGYGFDIKECPAVFGIGGSYEFAANNASLETYALWAKLGFSF